jgi:ABC-2 type transport system permease protein
MTWRPLWAIIEREMIRMIRQRGRLVSTAVRPLIWLLVVGAGFNAIMDSMGPYQYSYFLVPGVLGMVMLFGAMLVALSVVYDKEFGIMRLLITAPLPHYWIVLAKTLSATAVAVVQAGVMALLLAICGYVGHEVSIPLLILGLVSTALACASLGMVVAVWSSTLDNFAVIMNFVIFPVFFLSGALYPVQRLPPVLKVVAMINPFTYGVDLLKHALLGNTTTLMGTDFGIVINVIFLVGFSSVATLIACLRFSHESAAGLLDFLRS